MWTNTFILGSALLLTLTSGAMAQSAYSTGTADSTAEALGNGPAYGSYGGSEVYGSGLYAYAPAYGRGLTVRRRAR